MREGDREIETQTERDSGSWVVGLEAGEERNRRGFYFGGWRRTDRQTDRVRGKCRVAHGSLPAGLAEGDSQIEGS